MISNRQVSNAIRTRVLDVRLELNLICKRFCCTTRQQVRASPRITVNMYLVQNMNKQKSSFFSTNRSMSVFFYQGGANFCRSVLLIFCSLSFFCQAGACSNLHSDNLKWLATGNFSEFQILPSGTGECKKTCDLDMIPNQPGQLLICKVPLFSSSFLLANI